MAINNPVSITFERVTGKIIDSEDYIKDWLIVKWFILFRVYIYIYISLLSFVMLTPITLLDGLWVWLRP